jgi:hypothetical protein
MVGHTPPEVFLATEAAYLKAIEEGHPPRNDKRAAGSGTKTALGVTAERLELSLDQVRFHLTKAERYHARKGHDGFDPVLSGFEISRSSVQIGPDGETQKQWVTQKPERGDEFSLPAGHKIKGVSALVDGENRVLQQWVKTRLDETGVDFEKVIENVFTKYGDHVEPAPRPMGLDTDRMSVLPIVDVHFGAMSWGRESGEDYDMNIAAEDLKASASELIWRGANAAKLLILDPGDYFHANDDRAVTPQSGHHLDVDSRHAKVAELGVELTAHVIEEARRKYETVEYVKLPGNHDPEMSIMLSIAMAQRFRNDPAVVVRKSRERNFVTQFGKVMIAAAHGDMLKMASMAEWAAARHPEIWGQTTHRYGYTGHVHRRTAEERGGMIVESFAAFTAKDAWNAAMGHMGGRRMVLITLHKERGEIDRLTASIAPRANSNG